MCIAGTDISSECFCGQALENGSAHIQGKSELTGCNMPCTGNALEFCGGPNRLNIYGSLPAATSTPTQEVTSTSETTLQVLNPSVAH